MGIFTKTTGFFKDRLGKTRAKISSSLSSVLSLGRKIDENLLDELEETLISDDIGVETTMKPPRSELKKTTLLSMICTLSGMSQPTEPLIQYSGKEALISVVPPTTDVTGFA